MKQRLKESRDFGAGGPRDEGYGVSDRPPGEDRNRRLADLDRRLSAARGAKAPQRDSRREEFTAVSQAWRMIIELVMAIVIGGAMGWGLDVVFGTMPLFLIVFVLFGLAAGVRLMLRTAAEMNREKPDRADRDS